MGVVTVIGPDKNKGLLLDPGLSPWSPPSGACHLCILLCIPPSVSVLSLVLGSW